MKTPIVVHLALACLALSCDQSKNQSDAAAAPLPVAELSQQRKLFLDVHNLEPGKVKFEDVAGAHQKDLAVQGKYDVSFIKYWVDEAAGKVYCLAEATDGYLVHKTHKEAHGLVPDDLHLVSSGPEVALTGRPLFLDFHELGPGGVTAAAVADAHEKDLAVQGKYDVSFINYWVDEKAGVVVCLSEAAGPDAVIKTHTEAHGLVPAKVEPVKQGQ